MFNIFKNAPWYLWLHKSTAHLGYTELTCIKYSLYFYVGISVALALNCYSGSASGSLSTATSTTCASGITMCMNRTYGTKYIIDVGLLVVCEESL